MGKAATQTSIADNSVRISADPRQRSTHVIRSHVERFRWRKARARADLQQVRVHDLRHTFGHRLRGAGVSFEDRQDLLGHRSGRITSHYSAPDIARLLEAVESITKLRRSTVLRLATDFRKNSGSQQSGDKESDVDIALTS